MICHEPECTILARSHTYWGIISGQHVWDLLAATTIRQTKEMLQVLHHVATRCVTKRSQQYLAICVFPCNAFFATAFASCEQTCLLFLHACCACLCIRVHHNVNGIRADLHQINWIARPLRPRQRKPTISRDNPQRGCGITRGLSPPL